jgi:hypothetical protein
VRADGSRGNILDRAGDRVPGVVDDRVRPVAIDDLCRGGSVGHVEDRGLDLDIGLRAAAATPSAFDWERTVPTVR